MIFLQNKCTVSTKGAMITKRKLDDFKKVSGGWYFCGPNKEAVSLATEDVERLELAEFTVTPSGDSIGDLNHAHCIVTKGGRRATKKELTSILGPSL